MRWTGRVFVLFALVGLLSGVSDAAPQPPPIAPAAPDSAAPPLPVAHAPALTPMLAMEAGEEYLPHPASDGAQGFVASNPAQHLTAAFLPDTVRLHGDTIGAGGGASWGMRLARTGYGAELHAVTSAMPAIDGNRVVYARGATTEWYLNSPLGIEQGFTLATPPAGPRTGNLTLAVAFDGVERVDAGGAGLTLAVPGEGSVRYEHLLVTDAGGRTLPAWFSPVAGGVHIVVDDRDAVYPVTVDPLVQAGKLVAGDAATGDAFGFSVAVSADGNVALVGAPGKAASTGAAYVFTRSGNVWTQRQTLTASDGAAADGFGGAVALSADGSIALVSANGNAGNTGAAYVYTRSGNTWGTERKLTASDGVPNNFFGDSVALNGDGSIALVGAGGCSCANGAAYAYTRNGSIWGGEQKLTASDGAVGDNFGASVALSADGNIALIGADDRASRTGAAYAYTRSGGIWGTERKITASDGLPGDTFGISVALNGDGSIAIIGAPGCSCAMGAAYTYARSGGTWGTEQKLVASDGSTGNALGASVALNGDGSKASVGAPARLGNTGAVYFFARTGAVWVQQESIGLTNGVSGDIYGDSVATTMDGSTTLIGAPRTSGDSGAAYLFPAAPVVAASAGTTPQSTAVTTAFPVPLAVHVTDTLTAAPLANVAVQFVASPVGASGTFAGGSTTANVVTDGNGDATAPVFTANATNGGYVVSATVGGVTTPLFNLTNLPASATRMAISTGNNQSATIGTAFVDPFSVFVFDANGNGIGGVPVTFTAPASGAGGTFVGGGAMANATTNSNGFAVAPAFTANAAAGAYGVTANAAGVNTTARFNLTNLPGFATHYAMTLPPSAGAQQALAVTVTALDAGNNVATGYTGTVKFTSSDLAASLPANYPFKASDNGAHLFTLTLATIGVRSVTVTDMGAPGITTSQNVAVTPGIAGISPSAGPATGGTGVTITGSGLGGATSVMIGGGACTGITVNAQGTSLTCTLPGNQPAGSVDVVVATPNGAATLFHGYTFLPGSVQPVPGTRPGGTGAGPHPAPRPTGSR